MCTSESGDVQLEWLSQLGADLRARTQAEYVFTAAAVAYFGGVCWGLAALNSQPPERVMSAAGAIVLLTLAVTAKIRADHKVYRTTWKDRARIARALSA